MVQCIECRKEIKKNQGYYNIPSGIVCCNCMEKSKGLIEENPRKILSIGAYINLVLTKLEGKKNFIQ